MIKTDFYHQYIERRTKLKEVKIKEIRPTVAQLDFKSYNEFIDYASSTEKTKSVGMDRMREMMQQHKSKKS
ncbi:Uncharacterised protein [Paenibacillus polymyxa]|uniref:Uncharacterized protein n=1 Tax=Paenibacillus polymyxa TaxID=1406 RepID=A0A378XZ40_PAEPO|nr:hypothetical protein [Paenibacillus polymyxa]SUA70312.1 Uncharacterised protein [Paenibacillus polymyxa]